MTKTYCMSPSCPSGSPVTPWGKAKRLHGGNHATGFMPGNPSTAVAPQDRAGSPLALS
ncbi:hypothetical protein [Trichormus azollae]|uniref:hypothetical protein n=1 Tax=Trichormus azollae TaxID=1164 RepID=UPI0016511E62|nr:hypothetical protein [Trichormus azollae]